jgi:hypothetical protein
MSIYDILNLLSSTSSSLEKINILTQHKDNELLKKVFRCALDPYTQYHVKKTPKVKSFSGEFKLNEALDSIIDNLSTRKVTGNAAVNLYTKLLFSLSEQDAKVLTYVINRDLRCGVSVATINKVFPNLIPTYPCLLATAQDDKTIKNIVYPAYSQLKSDGVRINVLVNLDRESVEYRGRSGKTYVFNNTAMDSEFLRAAKFIGYSVVFDGEGLCKDTSGNILPRTTGNGIISKAQHDTISEEESNSVLFSIWDIIPLSDFNKCFYNAKYKDRYEQLEKLYTNLNDLAYSHLIETVIVHNYEEIQANNSRYIKQGLEGTIVKNFKGIWEDKRSKDQLKFKEEIECELQVIGYKEGTGKYTGQIGSLDCISADGVSVNISGFPDEFRKQPFTNLLNKIITVKYNALICDKKTKQYSLFLPRFVEVRDDKDEADCLLSDK